MQRARNGARRRARRSALRTASGREMQPGGRRGDGALLARHRWSGSRRGPRIVLRPLAGDVGRQRDMAEAGDSLRRAPGPARREASTDLAAPRPSPRPWRRAGRDEADLARLAEAGCRRRSASVFAGRSEGAPAIGRLALDAASPRCVRHRRRGPRSPSSCAGMTRGIVEHQRIAGAQQVRQVAHDCRSSSGRAGPRRRAAAPHRAAPPAAARSRSSGSSKSKRSAWLTEGAPAGARSVVAMEDLNEPRLGLPDSRRARLFFRRSRRSSSPALPPERGEGTARASAASAATHGVTIWSGPCTGSPRLILSTFSMPSTTLPQTVYWLSRKRASSKHDEELAVGGVRVLGAGHRADAADMRLAR